jgi:hypothetical protein
LRLAGNLTRFIYYSADAICKQELKRIEEKGREENSSEQKRKGHEVIIVIDDECSQC